MNANDILEMLRNPQAIQAKAEELRVRTTSLEATGSAGGGMVRITLNGALDMELCEISPEIIDPSDPGVLQDLVRAAYNDAAVKIREAIQKEFSTGMGNLPSDIFGGGIA